MIYQVARKKVDEQYIKEGSKKEPVFFDFGKVIVQKPWGYEYLVFENDWVAIWMLQIIRKRKTSMHCHPKKKTGLVLLSGHATFYHLEGTIAINRMNAINIDEGAFHCTEASSSLPIHPISENGIWVMEIESPPFKEDLCRLQDEYGRAGASYEGSSHMVFEPKETLRLEEPREGECFRKNFQDLIFTVRRGPIRQDKYFPKPNALVTVIARDPRISYTNPYLNIGGVFKFQDFYEKTLKLG